MTTPRDTPASRRIRANGDGTVYQRKDSRWEAAGYVLAPSNTRRRVRVYGTSRKEALAKLTEKIANSNRGLPIPSAQGSLAAYLTYWLENVAVHHLRENTHTRYAACVNNYLIPGLGKKKLTKLTAKDVRTWLNQLRTTCQCCARNIDAGRNQPRCCATGTCCSKRLSPLTLTSTPHSSPPWNTPCARRRSRAMSPATSAPAPHGPGVSNPSPPTKPAGSSPPRKVTGCTRVRTRPPHRTPQGRTPRPALGRPRPRRRHRRHPPHPSANRHRRAHHAAHQDAGLRAPHRPHHPLPPVTEAPPRTAAARA